MFVQASVPRNGRVGGDTTSWNGQGCGTALEASPVVSDYNRWAFHLDVPSQLPVKPLHIGEGFDSGI